MASEARKKKERLVQLDEEHWEAALKAAAIQGKDPETVLKESLSRAVKSINFEDIKGDQVVAVLGLLKLLISTMRDIANITSELGATWYRASLYEQVRTLKEVQREAIDAGLLADLVVKHIKESMPEITKKLEETVKTVKTEERREKEGKSPDIISSIIARILADMTAKLSDDIVRELEERGIKRAIAKTLADVAEYEFRRLAEAGGGAG